MLFLQTKFVKCKKIHYKNYFVIFTNFFFKLTNFRLYILKKIGYKIVCKIFFSVWCFLMMVKSLRDDRGHLEK